MRTISEMLLILGQYGYEYHEEVNVFETGLTHCLKKRTANDRMLLFNFWSDNQGGEPFWICELRLYVDLVPDDVYMHPCLALEVRNILEEHLGYIPSFERKLLDCAVAAEKLGSW